MIQSGLRIQKPYVGVVFVCLLPFVKIEILVACCIWNEMLFVQFGSRLPKKHGFRTNSSYSMKGENKKGYVLFGFQDCFSNV